MGRVASWFGSHVAIPQVALYANAPTATGVPCGWYGGVCRHSRGCIVGHRLSCNIEVLLVRACISRAYFSKDAQNLVEILRAYRSWRSESIGGAGLVTRQLIVVEFELIS